MGANSGMDEQLLRRRRMLVTFAVIGATVACLLMALALALVNDAEDPWADMPADSWPGTSATLSVLADGCTIEHGDIVGTSEARRLTWVVTDLDDTTVFEGMALEPRFRYSAAGTYRVYLKAWVDDAYYAISPTVTIRCP